MPSLLFFYAYDPNFILFIQMKVPTHILMFSLVSDVSLVVHANAIPSLVFCVFFWDLCFSSRCSAALNICAVVPPIQEMVSRNTYFLLMWHDTGWLYECFREVRCGCRFDGPYWVGLPKVHTKPQLDGQLSVQTRNISIVAQHKHDIRCTRVRRMTWFCGVRLVDTAKEFVRQKLSIHVAGYKVTIH